MISRSISHPKRGLILIALLVTTSTATRAASIFSSQSETAWAQYQQALVSLLGGGQAPVVAQPLAVAQRAEWDTASPEYNLFLKQDFANAMPNWTPLYTRSGANIPEEYQAFLDRLSSQLIKNTGFVDKKKLERIDTERRDLRARLQRLRREIEERWQKYVKETPPSIALTRAKWEEDAGYSADRRGYEVQLQQAEAAYILEANNAGPELAEIGRAIAALGSPIQQMPLPSSPELIPLGRDNWEYYYRTTVDGNLIDFKTERTPWTVTLRAGETETTSFSKTWGASAGASWCLFFNARGSVENEERSRKFEEETTEITISAENLKPFNIVRGAWFKAGLIREFVSRLDPSFWGKAGRLNIIPQQLILAHGLQIEVKTSQEMRDYFYSRHSAGGGGGFRLGPFAFGARGSSTTTHENTKIEKTDTGLRISDTSGRALVLAVVSQRPGDLIKDSKDPLYVLQPEAAQAKGLELLNAARKE